MSLSTTARATCARPPRPSSALPEIGIDADIELTDKAERVASADRIVLPGVGAYADCRRGLGAVDGMSEALAEAVEHKARPFFGICVGMQLMSSRGLEKTTTQGLGWIKGDVVEMTPSDPSLKIPQIGWNTLDLRRPHALFDGIKRRGRTACMPISCILITWQRLTTVTSSPPRTTAAR